MKRRALYYYAMWRFAGEDPLWFLPLDAEEPPGHTEFLDWALEHDANSETFIAVLDVLAIRPR